MPNLTTGLPVRTGDIEKDYNNLYDAFVSLVDELKAVLCNLDTGNVSEAAKVDAQNIDCSKAKIKDAQIKSLTADKLTAGTIDAGVVTVAGQGARGASVEIEGDSIQMWDKNNKLRIAIGSIIGDDGEEEYVFIVQNAQASEGIRMSGNDGTIELTGSINTGKDCRIQGELRVGLQGTMKGISFYGDTYNSNSSTPYAQIVPFTDVGGELKGINIIADGVWFNGLPIISNSTEG